MNLGCMHLNNLLAMSQIPLDLDNDGVWLELLMGQGGLLPRQNSLAACSIEVGDYCSPQAHHEARMRKARPALPPATNSLS